MTKMHVKIQMYMSPIANSGVNAHYNSWHEKNIMVMVTYLCQVTQGFPLSFLLKFLKPHLLTVP